MVAVTYTVRATHWEKGWELHIPDIGVTQSRTLATAPQQVVDYLATLWDLDVDTADVEIVPELDDPDLLDKIVNARNETRKAEEAQARASRDQRAVVRLLRKSHHLSVSDTATLMEISRGRVSQLSKKSL